MLSPIPATPGVETSNEFRLLPSVSLNDAAPAGPQLEDASPLGALYNRLLAAFSKPEVTAVLQVAALLPASAAGRASVEASDDEADDDELAAGGAGRHGFEFFASVVWKEVGERLMDELGGSLFAAGRPAELHRVRPPFRPSALPRALGADSHPASPRSTTPSRTTSSPYSRASRRRRGRSSPCASRRRTGPSSRAGASASTSSCCGRRSCSRSRRRWPAASPDPRSSVRVRPPLPLSSRPRYARRLTRLAIGPRRRQGRPAPRPDARGPPGARDGLGRQRLHPRAGLPLLEALTAGSSRRVRALWHSASD